MLKYQKSKVKLLEYEVPEEEWPSFPLNYRDLAYPTVYVISECAEAINENVNIEKELHNLRYCSEFYDAAFQSREQIIHDADFALSGATAYFFMDNFGSAKVLWQKADLNQINDNAQECLYEVFSLAFTGRINRKTDFTLIKAIESFWKNGIRDSLKKAIREYREEILKTDSPQSWFWGEITCAVANIIADTSARILLPYYSKLDVGSWEEYFKRRTAINLLWPSQRLVGISKMLEGENAVLQLPTGVGKTKSIELIIWSMFLSGRGTKALIVAPLRSLCNEITFEMKKAFPQKVAVNQFSDVLENDFIGILLRNTRKQILVCTPEKLQYIFHHDSSYLNTLDLFIFDESHMFDDRSRGALYELLLTDIKLEIKKNQQLVLMSAVLPNADQIVKWLFGDNGILAYNPSIKSTPKAVGFADGNKQLHYYSSAETNEDFFVPCTYKEQVLNPLKRERKERIFPENSLDKALYYTNVLCKAGGVAIYFPLKRSIPRLFRRIKDLDERGYSLDRIKTTSDSDELLRFQALYKEYYGKDDIYTQTIQYGILPHYSSLPNGLKISTEYAFKKNKVKAVACTSTLAQGVNIPIKYLVITGTNFSATQMTVRNFQNLIGRTGRSGVYTAGDIIVTEKTLYENRKKGKGFYKWSETINLFDGMSVEACGSSILNIVRDYNVSYNIKLPGSEIVQIICDNIHCNWVDKLLDILIDRIEKEETSNDARSYKLTISERISNYKEAIDSIENEMIYLLSHHPLSIKSGLLREISTTLLENTLAYYLASEEEKIALKQLFDAIERKVEANINNIHKYYGIMVSMADADQIAKWINDNNINAVNRSAKDILMLLEGLFAELYPDLNLEKGIALSWIRGDSYSQMSEEFGIKIADVEKQCQYSISFQMSFLVGNIIDLVSAECVNLDALQLLQQTLKYGVNTKTAVSICESIFNDRFLAKEITLITGNNEVSIDDIVLSVKAKKEEVLLLLKNYPSYFESIVVNL